MVSRRPWWFFALVAFVMGLALVWLVLARHSAQVLDMEPTGEKVIRFSYTLSNSTSANIEEFQFSAFAPVHINGYQTLNSVDVTHEHTVAGDPHMRNIHLNVAGLAPYASRLITVTMGVGVYDARKYERIEPSDYMVAEPYIEIDEPDISRLANRIAESSTDFPKDAFEWVRNNIVDAGYIAQNRGALFAVQERRGDCTEFMYTFVALARAQGIPARGVAGFVVHSNAAVLSASDYHNWAEFYDGERWVLVDPYKGVFDDQYENYLAFRLLGGTNNYSGSARRFLVVDERISVKL